MEEKSALVLADYMGCSLMSFNMHKHKSILKIKHTVPDRILCMFLSSPFHAVVMNHTLF